MANSLRIFAFITDQIPINSVLFEKKKKLPHNLWPLGLIFFWANILSVEIKILWAIFLLHWKYLLIRKQSFTFRGIRFANLAHRILRAIELVQLVWIIGANWTDLLNVLPCTVTWLGAKKKINLMNKHQAAIKNLLALLNARLYEKRL